MHPILILCALVGIAWPVDSAAQQARGSDASSMALFEAILAEDTAEVRRLLRAGADPDRRIVPERNGEEVMPLEAVSLRNPALMRLLLEAGAHPDVFRCDDFMGIHPLASPLAMAEFAGEGELIDLLRAAGADDQSVPGAELAVTRAAQSAPLHAAVWRADAAAVANLLEAGADPHAPIVGRTLADGTAERFSPLGLALRVEAAAGFDEEIVRLLLAAGADPNERFAPLCTEERLTPLLVASGRGDAGVVRLLLGAGADPNQSVEIEDWGNRDLALLAGSGDALHGESYVPLRLALEAGHAEVAALLRAAGAAEPVPVARGDVASPGIPSDPIPTTGANAVPSEFEMAFASCTPGARMTASLDLLGARVRYEVRHPVENGCQVAMIFESNPNPAWVDRPLLVTLDPASRFHPQLMDAFTSCMTNADSRFNCAGPLRELLRSH